MSQKLQGVWRFGSSSGLRHLPKSGTTFSTTAAFLGSLGCGPTPDHLSGPSWFAQLTHPPRQVTQCTDNASDSKAAAAELDTYRAKVSGGLHRSPRHSFVQPSLSGRPVAVSESETNVLLCVWGQATRATQSGDYTSTQLLSEYSMQAHGRG